MIHWEIGRDFMNDALSNVNKICPCAVTISLLSSKWKILIMRDLLAGPKRYSDLKRSVMGISQKMLTQSLKEMAADGLVNRHVYPEVPPCVEYSLSNLGASLRPVIYALNKWRKDYLQKSNPAYIHERFNIAVPKNRWLINSERFSNIR